MKKNKTVPTENHNYSEIRHIISYLYRIKTIDRKIEYSIIELEKLVLNSPTGEEVLKQLIEKKVSLVWLKENGFIKVSEIFSAFLP